MWRKRMLEAYGQANKVGYDLEYQFRQACSLALSDFKKGVEFDPFDNECQIVNLAPPGQKFVRFQIFYTVYFTVWFGERKGWA